MKFKSWILFGLLLLALKGNAQVIKGAGVIYFDSMPNVNAALSGSELAYSIKMKKVFRWNRQNSTWVEISSDTTSLSNRINLKRDTADVIPILKGGTGATTAAAARTNLGLVIGTDVLAPTGSAANLTNFPPLNQNTTGTASNVTGTVAIANGGTGATTAADARTNLGLVIGTNVLAPNGSAAGLTNFPTLNQSTTGTAANVTGTVAIANGGTGATTAANARTNLLPNQPGNENKYLRTNGSDVFWDNVSGGSGTVTGTGAANKVAFWTDPTTLSNNSNFHWDNSNGRLGIGTSTPAATLSLSVPDIDQNLNGGFGLRSDHTRGFNRQQTVVAMNSKSSPGSGVTFTSDYTAQAFNMAHNGAGTSSFLTSLNVRVGVGGGGSVTDLIGLGILTPFQWAATVGATPFTGTVTNLYGIRVSSSAASTANASITNNYGLYIQSPTTGVPSGTVSVSNDYSIYAPDAVQKAYIGGQVGIGTASPQNLLHVAGSFRVDDAALSANPGFNATRIAAVDDNGRMRSIAIGAGLALNTTTHTLSATGGTAGTVTVIGTPAVGQIAVWAGTSSIQGVNSLDVAKGGTGATTAADARTNLGLVIGTNVLAPNGSAAGLTNFPTLNQNTTGTATNVTGTVAITNGGTGATTAADARTNLGLVIGTNVLAPNGSAAGLTNFPTLNQNTTGTASNVTGTVAAANGGTGQSIYATGDILYANTTTTLAKLSPSTAGRVLITNGSGQAPSWSDVGTAVTTLTTPTAISGSTTVTFNASGKPMAVFRQASSSGATTTITSVTISNPVTGGVYSIHLPTPTGPANQVQVNWNTTTPAFKDLALTNLGTRYYTTATIITCYYDGTDFICK